MSAPGTLANEHAAALCARHGPSLLYWLTVRGPALPCHPPRLLQVDPLSLAALQVFCRERHPSAMGLGQPKEGFSLYGVAAAGCATQAVRALDARFSVRVGRGVSAVHVCTVRHGHVHCCEWALFWRCVTRGVRLAAPGRVPRERLSKESRVPRGAMGICGT